MFVWCCKSAFMYIIHTHQTFPEGLPCAQGFPIHLTLMATVGYFYLWGWWYEKTEDNGEKHHWEPGSHSAQALTLLLWPLLPGSASLRSFPHPTDRQRMLQSSTDFCSLCAVPSLKQTMADSFLNPGGNARYGFGGWGQQRGSSFYL